MNTLIFGIILSALFSATSLFVVILRVSPLTAPQQAVPAFFLSLFLTVSTVGTLLFLSLWKVLARSRIEWLPVHAWDTGKLTSISLRQGILLGFSTTVLVLFLLLNLLNWWIGVLIYGVAGVVEVALEH